MSDSVHILRFGSAHEYYRTVEYELERTSGALAGLYFLILVKALQMFTFKKKNMLIVIL